MAARTPGGFVPLDMNYMRDERIRRAGPDAELLYIRSLAHCKAGQTEGLVADYDLDVVGVGLKNLKGRANALVREGLWIPVAGGWLIRSWAKWNKTRDEIAEDKAKKSAAAIKTNHDRWHGQKQDSSCPHCMRSVTRLEQRA